MRDPFPITRREFVKALAGLAAAVFARRRGRSESALVLDNHAAFGGEAKGDFERAIRDPFTEMFAASLVRRDARHHPPPPRGRFCAGRRSSTFAAFVNTDLAGAMDHRNAIAEARRAVAQTAAMGALE
jgi:hypothetical protein